MAEDFSVNLGKDTPPNPCVHILGWALIAAAAFIPLAKLTQNSPIFLIQAIHLLLLNNPESPLLPKLTSVNDAPFDARRLIVHTRLPRLAGGIGKSLADGRQGGSCFSQLRSDAASRAEGKDKEVFSHGTDRVKGNAQIPGLDLRGAGGHGWR
jgi:hypothetical protein